MKSNVYYHSKYSNLLPLSRYWTFHNMHLSQQYQWRQRMLQQFCILHHISIISYSYCQFITVSSLLSYVFISNFITSVSGSFFLKALFGYQKGLLRLKPAIKSSLISIISYSCRGQTPISHFHFTLEKRFLRSPHVSVSGPSGTASVLPSE